MIQAKCHLSFFDYQFIEVVLWTETRSMEIKLVAPSFSIGLIEELNKAFHWLSEHHEVHSVLIRGAGEFGYFNSGLLAPELAMLSPTELKELSKKFTHLCVGANVLPQIFIIDAGTGAKNIACEFIFSCADVVVAHQDCLLSLEYGQMGLAPLGPGLQFMLHKFPGHTLRTMLLTSSKMSLSSSPSLHGQILFYQQQERLKKCQEMLKSIYLMAPACRIQMKAAAQWDSDFKMLKQKMAEEQSFYSSIWSLNEWNKFAEYQAKENAPIRELLQSFIPARDMKNLISNAQKEWGQQSPL